MNDVFNEITFRWSKREQTALLPKPMRRRLVAALKSGNGLAVEMVEGIVDELEEVMREAGFTGTMERTR